MVETLGEAYSYRWRVTARCAASKQDGMHRHKECVYRAELTWKHWFGPAAERSPFRGWRLDYAVPCAVRATWCCYLQFRTVPWPGKQEKVTFDTRQLVSGLYARQFMHSLPTFCLSSHRLRVRNQND